MIEKINKKHSHTLVHKVVGIQYYIYIHNIISILCQSSPRDCIRIYVMRCVFPDYYNEKQFSICPFVPPPPPPTDPQEKEKKPPPTPNYRAGVHSSSSSSSSCTRGSCSKVCYTYIGFTMSIAAAARARPRATLAAVMMCLLLAAFFPTLITTRPYRKTNKKKI